MKDQRVVFLFTPGPIGGAEKIVLFGVKALIEAGIEVSLWVIKEERVPLVADKFIKLLIENGIKSKTFSSRNIFDRQLQKELKLALVDEAPAIIHAHGFKAAFYAKLVAPKDSHLVITHHGKTGHTLKVKVYEFIEDLIMKRASAVVAVSQDMKIALVKAGVLDRNISVVENFMTSKAIPKRLSNGNPIKLLFVGRLSPEKGCSVLIDAMINLDQTAFKLTIVGDGVEKNRLEAKVISLGLTENVSFTGFQSNPNEYMATSDAIVMPSFREGQPLTLIEACCMGIPVVASHVGGIPELIIDNKNGFLCEAGNSQQLSAALTKLIINLPKLQKTAEEARFEYIKRFSGSTWAEATIKVYASVLSHS